MQQDVYLGGVKKGGLTSSTEIRILLCYLIATVTPLNRQALENAGISPEDMPRIFEKGYTGYNGRLDKKSTGLGLYLCRKAADRLGHVLTAESEPGKGSRFTIDLESYPFRAE